MEITLLTAVLFTLSLPSITHANDCRVLDPELQGFYEGGCKKGLAHGHGYARGNAAEYEGEFRRGMKHGNGEKRWQWGDFYVGQFYQDRKQGQGMYVWGADSPWAGERYVGQFKADKRDGRGTYYWPTGDRFEGLWKNDLRYGKTAAEERRELSTKARAEALATPGTTVCSSVPVGIAFEAGLRGSTEGLEDGRLKVRITEIVEKEPRIRPSIDVGALLLGDPWEWKPCL
jgi:hypothetical protein